MKERPSQWVIAFILLLSGATACAQDACERLTAEKIPNTTITLAHIRRDGGQVVGWNACG